MRRRTIVAAVALMLIASIAGYSVSQSPAPLALPMPPMIEALTDTVQMTPLPAASVATMPRLDPLVIGATEADAQGWQHLWPGVQWRARFSGTGLWLLFDDSVNRYRIEIDGHPVGIVTRPGNQGIALAGLADGAHDITLVKINESHGPARFGGFFLPTGTDGLPPPPPAPMLIEFIGDSDTVGYGNTVVARACTADTVFLTTDISRSFGPRVAAHLGADYRMIARSGIGLVRNYDGSDPGRTMATLY
ncbi:MAG: lipase, partial [Gemmobacter sp.]